MNDFSRKIRIAFIVWTLEGMSGSEKVVYDIARKLNKERYHIVIVGFADGPIRKMYEDIGARVYVICKKKRVDFKFTFNLRKILTDEDVDIVNPHHFGPLLYSFLATRFTRVKLVYTEHSQWQLAELTPLKNALNRLFLLRADAVVAISKQIEDYYRNVLKLKKDKIHCITNGVDLAFYGTGDGNNLKRRLGLQHGEKIVGTVGNLRPEKNHKLLVSAFSRVAKELDDLRLVLVGLDCMNGEIQRFASESGAGGKIFFLGQRNDVPDLLKIFDAFCLPSDYEGMPLTLLEAMASGVPVIGSDVLGINEVVTDCVNGLLFPKNDEKKLVELIKRSLKDNDLRKKLIQEGKSFVEKYHNLEDRIKEYDILFQTIGKSD